VFGTGKPLLKGTSFRGLYYTLMTIVNDDSRVINKIETSLNDVARVVIYDCHMFIVYATGRLQQRPDLQTLDSAEKAYQGQTQ
jgi:hypothetical protein